VDVHFASLWLSGPPRCNRAPKRPA
jgi:hypothetical protein